MLRSLKIILMLLLLACSGCGKIAEFIDSFTASETRPTSEEDLSNRAYGLSIQGTITMPEELTGVVVVAVVNLGTDLTITPPVAAIHPSGGPYQMNLPPLEFYQPFGVIAYRDEDGNALLSEGEEFVWALPEYRFMATEAGTIVGNEPLAFSEADFNLSFSQ